MKTDSFTFAARAKGPFALLKRTLNIAKRYGLTPAKMDQALQTFFEVLGQFDCGASFPLTAVALQRNSHTITRYLDQNIEFNVHGYTHIDYSQLQPEEQLAHLRRAREIFAAAGIKAAGFRSPYLRRDAQLYTAIEAVGFSYVSNQPVMWDVIDVEALAPTTRPGYERAIAFYDPWYVDRRPSLPQLYNEIVEIPVSLPDDEILLDRLEGARNDLVKQTWGQILLQSHRRGEVFTLQLHPERIAGCLEGLEAVLTEAHTLTPGVWFARLDEIADWWRHRTAARVDARETTNGGLQLSVAGPPGTTILIRNVDVVEPTEPWAGGYSKVKDGNTLTCHCERRPFIGVAPNSPPALTSFLRQQGYVVQTANNGQTHTLYLDPTNFTPADQRPLLAKIENSNTPLIRLGRWPNGAQSALVVSGDIDALTLWDYGLRLLGR